MPRVGCGTECHGFGAVMRLLVDFLYGKKLRSESFRVLLRQLGVGHKVVAWVLSNTAVYIYLFQDM